jgi:hypothetical protein
MWTINAHPSRSLGRFHDNMGHREAHHAFSVVYSAHFTQWMSASSLVTDNEEQEEERRMWKCYRHLEKT